MLCIVFLMTKPIRAHYFSVGPHVLFENSTKNDPLVGYGDKSGTLR